MCGGGASEGDGPGPIGLAKDMPREGGGGWLLLLELERRRVGGPVVEGRAEHASGECKCVEERSSVPTGRSRPSPPSPFGISLVTDADAKEDAVEEHRGRPSFSLGGIILFFVFFLKEVRRCAALSSWVLQEEKEADDVVTRGWGFFCGVSRVMGRPPLLRLWSPPPLPWASAGAHGGKADGKADGVAYGVQGLPPTEGSHSSSSGCVVILFILFFGRVMLLFSRRGVWRSWVEGSTTSRAVSVKDSITLCPSTVEVRMGSGLSRGVHD